MRIQSIHWRSLASIGAFIGLHWRIHWIIHWRSLASTGACRGFPTPVNRSGCPNYVSKLMKKSLEKISLIQILGNNIFIAHSTQHKAHSTQHALFRLFQKWQKELDSSGIVGTILMDLSKAYDCLPHDLIIAKLEACGLDTNSLRFIFGYLSSRK